jgi:hypothetical protein
MTGKRPVYKSGQWLETRPVNPKQNGKQTSMILYLAQKYDKEVKKGSIYQECW